MVRRIAVEHMFRQRPDFGRETVEGPGFHQTGIAQCPLGIVVAGDKPPPATAGQCDAMDRLGGAQVSIEQVGVAPGSRTQWAPTHAWAPTVTPPSSVGYSWLMTTLCAPGPELVSRVVPWAMTA